MSTNLYTRFRTLAVACMIASTALAQPINDECSGAVPLPIGPDDCSQLYDISTADATDSGVPLACDPTTVGYRDIWYSFNSGPNTFVYIDLSPASSGIDWNFAIYDVCGGGVLGCSVNPVNTSTVPVAANTTYYLRVESNLQYGSGGLMQLCISANAPQAPPTNDQCDAPTVLTMGTSCVPTAGTLANSTGDELFNACGVYEHNDVWYQFVATATAMHLEIQPDPLLDVSAVLLSNSSCFNGNATACINDQGEGELEDYVYEGLVLGATYFIHVINAGPSEPQTPGFAICVWGAPPPVNNNCSGAIALPMTAECTPVSGYTSGATWSGPTSGCGNGNQEQDDDVWYTVTATSGDLLLTVEGDGNASTGFDPVVELLYANNCNGSFNQITCADNTGPGDAEEIAFSGLSVGITYYVLVYDAGTDAPGTGTFTICAQDMNNTGIPSNNGHDLWSVSVDASTAHLVLDYHGAPAELGALELMDMTGRILRRWTTSLHEGARRMFAMGGTLPGQYIIALELDGTRSVQRVLVER